MAVSAYVWWWFGESTVIEVKKMISHSNRVENYHFSIFFFFAYPKGKKSEAAENARMRTGEGTTE